MPRWSRLISAASPNHQRPFGAVMIDKPSENHASGLSEELAATKVHWDQSQMRTEFANVINVFSTREEFSVLFGMNGTLSLAEAKAFEVKLSNRIVLTPFAAKRLAILLNERVAEYEKRHGALNIGI
jgi:hypothetical protein